MAVTVRRPKPHISTNIQPHLILLLKRHPLAKLDHVNKLVPFDSSGLQKFEIFSDMMIDAKESSRFLLTFKIDDEMSEVDLEKRILLHEGNSLERKDELWKMTCFEMFLNPIGQKQYYEFNVSLEGAWNCYHFAGYRFPQPPQPSNDFEIEKILWKSNQKKKFSPKQISFKTAYEINQLFRN